jgi:catechol 2,3-dioxygenase-like lactoylglutathione lyase family enzyme
MPSVLLVAHLARRPAPRDAGFRRRPPALTRGGAGNDGEGMDSAVKHGGSAAGAPAKPAATSGARLATVVMFVRDLDASVRFYRELLAMEVTVRDHSAALLVGADADQLYLREIGPRSPHFLGNVGVQYVIWAAADIEDLRRCAQFLQEASARVRTQTVDGITFVEGQDPSGLPVVVTFPGPDQTARHRIMGRIYNW